MPSPDSGSLPGSGAVFLGAGSSQTPGSPSQSNPGTWASQLVWWTNRDQQHHTKISIGTLYGEGRDRHLVLASGAPRGPEHTADPDPNSPWGPRPYQDLVKLLGLFGIHKVVVPSVTAPRHGRIAALLVDTTNTHQILIGPGPGESWDRDFV